MSRTRFSVLLCLILIGLALIGCRASPGAESVLPTSTADEAPAPPAHNLADPDAAAGFDCASVSEIPNAECRALVAFYESTNGPAWAEDGTPWEEGDAGWLETNTPCGWVGVTCVGGHVGMLALFYNDLKGQLPADLAELTHLRVLDLHNNALNGEIPAEFGRLSGLEALDLSANEVTGSIPATLGDLGKLRFLALPHNKLERPIPPELGRIATLETLDLSHNQLDGEIPASLADLRALGTLRLNDNQLEGAIPFGLGELPALTELDLAFNRLSGSAPSGVSKVPIQQLWGNRLDGTIVTGAEGQQQVSYLGASFSYDSSLAGSVWPELIPERPAEPGPGPLWFSPEYIRFTLVGANGPQPHAPMGLRVPAEAQIHIYPAAELNEVGQAQVEALQQLLAERPAAPDFELPLLPPTNASQLFRSQVVYLDLQNGSGVRYLTQYVQDARAINNEEIFYTFQGLSADGATYVAAFFPVTTPMLPAEASGSEALLANYEAYLEDTIRSLDAATADVFSPDLSRLDALVSSLSTSGLTPAKELEGLWPNDGESVDGEPALQWTGFRGATRYELVVVDDDAYPPFVAFEQSTTETVVPVTPALAPGSYSWTVRALDESGAVLAELNRQFLVKAALEAVEPAEDAEVAVSPKLQWQPFPGATEYYVFLLSGYPPEIVFEATTSETSLVVDPALEPGEFYYWSVWAQDDNGVVLAELNSFFTVEGE